jgi:hypothetical protein
MDRRLVYAALVFSLACSGGKNNPGSTGGAGGSGGTAAGRGGASAGSGGASAGSGGSATAGSGGSATAGSGGSATAGAGGSSSAGAGGSAGTGGTTGGSGGSPPASSASVLERNKNPSRDGHFIQPALTKAAAAKMVLDANFNPTFPGTMWASPLYLENGPGGKGLFFAVTNQNNVYAFDETTGAMVWMKNVGTPATVNGPNATCGNIHPLGILATPVIDAAARTIFVSAAVGNATQILRQEVHALNVDDGQERPGWPVDVSGKVGFDPQPHNPRSALSLVGGIVYVAYGGHVGDCGDYRGRVVAIDSKDPTKVAGWATGGRAEAIWAPGGMASDGNGVIATTGNRMPRSNTGAHNDSEQVMRITGMATLTRGPENVYFPGNWLNMDATDADFGSSSPIVINVPGAASPSMVVATAKTGHVYFLDAKRLGGMGGELFDLNAGTSGFTAPAGYRTGKGTFVALTLGSAMCPMGQSGQVAGILVAPGPPLKPEVVWCAPATGRYSPIATTVDGTNEALVWFMNGSKLNAVDGETGQVVFNGGAGDCGGVIKWTSPIAVKGRIVVGAGARLCSWSPAP